MHRLWFAMLLVIALQGCSALPLPFAQPLVVPASQTQPIFVASSRKREDNGAFGLARAEQLSFARYQVALPPNRKPGAISAGLFNTNMDVAVTSTRSFSSIQAFTNAAISQARADKDSSQLMVFVHGFNSDFEGSLFRVAQIDRDFNFASTTILYAWPSANRLISYIYDLDSTTFARDGLVETLRGLARSNASRIVVVGHSLGARLAMQALREMRLRGEERFFAKLGGVALLSPDMDLDLFKSDLRSLGQLKAPVVSYYTHDDATLQNFSDVLIEGKSRLGLVEDIETLDGLAVTLVDLSHIDDPDQRAHLVVATSPRMINAINEMAQPDLIGYAEMARRGQIKGSLVTRFGQSVRVEISQY